VSAGGGIQIYTSFPPGVPNLIRDNTSIENSPCDIDEEGTGSGPNVWSNNRSATKCGAATDEP